MSLCRLVENLCRFTVARLDRAVVRRRNRVRSSVRGEGLSSLGCHRNGVPQELSDGSTCGEASSSAQVVAESLGGSRDYSPAAAMFSRLPELLDKADETKVVQ